MIDVASGNIVLQKTVLSSALLLIILLSYEGLAPATRPEEILSSIKVFDPVKNMLLIILLEKALYMANMARWNIILHKRERHRWFYCVKTCYNTSLYMHD